MLFCWASSRLPGWDAPKWGGAGIINFWVGLLVAPAGAIHR